MCGVGRCWPPKPWVSVKGKGTFLMSRAHEIVLWYCPRCDIYFFRHRAWSLTAKHYPEYRPNGPGRPILAQMRGCPGLAGRVTEGPVFAAYLLGGPEAVYAMGHKVN